MTQVVSAPILGVKLMDEILEELEIDLEVCGLTEVLEAHGVDWTPELVTELWHCVEAGRESGAGKGL